MCDRSSVIKPLGFLFTRGLLVGTVSKSKNVLKSYTGRNWLGCRTKLLQNRSNFQWERRVLASQASQSMLEAKPPQQGVKSIGGRTAWHGASCQHCSSVVDYPAHCFSGVSTRLLGADLSILFTVCFWEGGYPFHVTFCTLCLPSLITTLMQGIILDMDSWTSSLELRILEVLPQRSPWRTPNKLHIPVVFQREKRLIPQDHTIFGLLDLIKAETVHMHAIKATWNTQCCYWNPFIFIEIWYVNIMHEK